MKLSNWGEFEFIREIKSSIDPLMPKDELGIGDDCAILPLGNGKSQLITTDSMVEGVHFLRSTITPEQLGFKLLAVNISDIAAMGGTPTRALITLSLPKDLSLEWLRSLYSGLSRLAKRYGIRIIGGDTTRSLRDIVVGVTLLGEADLGYIKLRSGAGPGDLIAVTRNLGDSAGGLKLLEWSSPEVLGTASAKALVKSHLEPEPEVEVGQWLAKQAAVTAMMDVSDGLDSDLKRILEASEVGARIQLESLPLSPGLTELSRSLGWNAQEIAATGGEEYCLLFTCSREKSHQLADEFEKKFQRKIHFIGETTVEKRGFHYFLKSEPRILSVTGFQHFT